MEFFQEFLSGPSNRNFGRKFDFVLGEYKLRGDRSRNYSKKFQEFYFILYTYLYLPYTYLILTFPNTYLL